MKIKKPIKAVPGGQEASASTGGATIADRFKLEPTAPAKAKGSVSKSAALAALVAALAGLALSGILTYVLYQHLEFLKPV